MAFTRVKTVRKKNGKSYQYRYREYRWREGKKVRSKSILIGALAAVGSFIEDNITRTHGVDWDRVERDAIARQEQKQAGRQAVLDRLHAAYGLTVGPVNPTPIDKTVSNVLSEAAGAGVPESEHAEDAGSGQTPSDENGGEQAGP